MYVLHILFQLHRLDDVSLVMGLVMRGLVTMG